MNERSHRSSLAAVFSTSLGVGLIFGFEPPLIAMVLSRGGASSAAVGAVTAIGLVAVILVGPMYPRAIARLGLKRSIIAGVGVAALILLLMPRWPNVPAWLLLRLLTGAALGLSWIASEIWMNRASADAARGTVMGVYGMVFSTGTVAGPILLEFTGTRGAWPFAIGALCLCLTLLPLALVDPPPEQGDAEGAPLGESLRALGAMLRAAPVIMLAALVAGLVEGADLSLLPLLGVHAGLSERAALLLLSVFLAGNVALQLPIGLLADRFGRAFMLGICALASGIGPLLLTGAFKWPALLWPLLFIWGGTLYAFYSQGVALLGERFAAADVPRANTLFVMVYCLGGVAGPGAGGIAMDLWPHRGLPALLSIGALLLLAGLLVDRRVR